MKKLIFKKYRIYNNKYYNDLKNNVNNDLSYICSNHGGSSDQIIHIIDDEILNVTDYDKDCPMKQEWYRHNLYLLIGASVIAIIYSYYV